MKLVTRTQKLLAILMGIALLATLVVQVWRDGRRLDMKAVTNFNSISK